MIANTRELRRLFATCLEAEGFTYQKSGSYYDVWSHSSYETTACLVLSRSRWGKKYGLEFRCQVLSVPPFIGPGEFFKMHIRLSLEPSLRQRVERLLNLEEQNFSGTDREDGLMDIINDYVKPTLLSLGSINGVSQVLQNRDVYDSPLVAIAVKDLFN